MGGLTDFNEMTFKVPEGMTEEEFRAGLNRIAHPKKNPSIPDCKTCIHWSEGSSNRWEEGGHCRFYSSTCVTAVFNHQFPSRYDPK